MFFRSRNLFLRPFWPEDMAGLQAAIGETAFARACSGATEGGAVPVSQPRLPRCVIARPGASGEQLIGAAGLFDRDGGIFLELWIGPEFRGRGFATEAARSMIEIARTAGHGELRAKPVEDCATAEHVMSKAGFAPPENAAVTAGQGGAADYLRVVLDHPLHNEPPKTSAA